MIDIRAIAKTYRSRQGDVVEALAEVSLDVRDKEFVSLVGPSGCGKSTMLKLVAGLVAPTRGEIVIDGRAVREPFPDVGFVFQSAVLLPWRTVLDNVLFSIEMLGRPREPYRTQALALIELAGLAGFEGKYPWELSGGMQQRVALCRALVHDPSLLLMDEPFGALDAMTREFMNLELLRIWKESGKTIVFITHSIPEAAFLADRVIVMSARPGRIKEIVEVRLPRPRDLDMMASDEFGVYTRRIRHLFDARGWLD